MAMRPVHRCLAVALPALMLVACGDRREQEDDTAPTAADQTATSGTAATDAAGRDTAATDQSAMPEVTSPADAGATPATGPVMQQEALGLLAAANEHEVAAADQAIAKKVTGDVLAFANMMKTDHGKNLAETSALGGTSEGTKIAELRSKGEAELAALDAKSGTEYEQAYIDAMVKGHTEVLALLDGTLIPAATDEAVKTHFAQTRTAVARHLDEAKKLKAGP
jgi:putative membrane protein